MGYPIWIAHFRFHDNIDFDKAIKFFIFAFQSYRETWISKKLSYIVVTLSLA